MGHATVLITDNLDLNVSRPGDETLDEQRPVSERRLSLARAAFEGFLDLG